MQSNTIINLLRNDETSKFIGLHLNDDAKKLAFDANKYKNIDIKSISTLISLYQKAKKKLPEHYKTLAALNSKAYEQCTSEIVAIVKAEIMETNDKIIINISGGLGIDDWAFSKNAKFIFSCDTDSEINDLAKFNIEKFSIKNIKRILSDGIEYIDNVDYSDIIYADPDRRINIKKTFKLEDCSPNILNNIEKLLDKTQKLWIKVSPMADLSYLKNKIPQIDRIFVIALAGEVKEILLSCNKNIVSKTQITAVSISNDKVLKFAEYGTLPQNKIKSKGKFLYDPCNSILKAGLILQYAGFLKLNLISIKSNLYVSDGLIKEFQGKIFEIISIHNYKPAKIKEYLMLSGIKSANITSKNFIEKAENLWIRYKLKTGGNDYLYFTTDFENCKLMYHCRLITY